MSHSAISRGLRVLSLQMEADLLLRRNALTFKYDPNQPRDERGRWAESANDRDEVSQPSAEPSTSITRDIVSRFRQLNASTRSDAYTACLDLCYPLIERFQPPGSDRNTWDFHKCMNACLGKTR